MNLRSISKSISGQYNIERQLKEQISRSRRAVDELQDELDSGFVEEGRLEILKSQLHEAQEDLLTQEGSFKEAQAAKTDLARSSSEIEASLADIEQRAASISQELLEAEKQRLKHEESRRGALHEKNKAYDTTQKLHAREKELKAQRDGQVEVVADFKTQAAAVCTRLPVDPHDTEQSINQKLEKMQKELQKAEKR